MGFGNFEFKLEVWTCNPIQDANLADKEASKTIRRTQFELDSQPALHFVKGKPATAFSNGFNPDCKIVQEPD